MPASDLLVTPAPQSWREALAGAPADDRRLSLRRELGLPTDRPIVMSGHQTEIWHAGILAKAFAAEVAASAWGGAWSWLGVDQDATPPAAIAYPVRREGVLARARWDLELSATRGMPTACRRPIGVSEALAAPRAVEGVPASVVDGLARIARALRDRAEDPTLGAQMTHAAMDLACAGGLLRPAVVLATALGRTSAFAEVMDRARSEPQRAWATYNDAARSIPEARVRPLGRRGAAFELPAWIISDSGPRQPAYSDTPASATLAPRALLMTLIARAWACDLFIHGLGGGVYDQVTDRWASAWLGTGVGLAPTAVVTATIRMPLGDEALPTPEEIRASAWLAHHARHAPTDEPLARVRAESLARIAALPRRHPARRIAFQELHAALDAHRERCQGELSKLADRARSMRASRRQSEIAHDRTWAFPLHAGDALAGLRDRIRRALGGVS